VDMGSVSELDTAGRKMGLPRQLNSRIAAP